MAKLGCSCGHVISDSTDFIRYKATFICDQHAEVRNKTIGEICSFMEAYKEGKKVEWLKNRFGDRMESEASNEWIIMQLEMDNEMDSERFIFQCEVCNRLHVETAEGLKYATFVAEEGAYQNLFAREVG